MIPVRYNLRSLAVRKRTTIATALGIALVVFVLASALMLADGVERTMGKSGRSDKAIVLRKGSVTELESMIEDPKIGLILAAPGVKKDSSGASLGTGEVVVVAAVEKIGTEGGVSNAQIRGVRDDVVRFRPEVKVIAGRPARPGADEAIIGKRIRGRFAGVDLGQKFEIRKNRHIEVVGVFEDGGSSFESEIWADLDVVRTSFGREGLVSSVRVQLESPEKFDAFEAVMEQDKQLGLDAIREPAYYEKQSEATTIFVTGLGVVIAVFFSIGAMIGAMITMYAAVAHRSREIGTLRALGFSRASIMTSFLIEAIFLALAGGVLGAIASSMMGFVHFSMMNFQTWSEIVFSFTPTPKIITVSFAFAAGMGLLGGFFPAVRASRMSPLAAIRD